MNMRPPELSIKRISAVPSCRSPIEMSPVPPIEMSLGQAVVEAFGVTCDDGDPNERSGTDPTSCHDRPGRRPDYRGGRGGVDGSRAAPGFPAASWLRCGWRSGADFPQARSPEQPPTRRDIPTHCSGIGPTTLLPPVV